jgi:hypothetical protein
VFLYLNHTIGKINVQSIQRYNTKISHKLHFISDRTIVNYFHWCLRTVSVVLHSTWSTGSHQPNAWSCKSQQLRPRARDCSKCFANECCSLQGEALGMSRAQMGLSLSLSSQHMHKAPCQGCGRWWKLVHISLPECQPKRQDTFF